MSENITVARPYAKAAFDFALEHNRLDNWQTMLAFAAQVSCDSQMRNYLSADLNPEKLADLFIAVCGEILDEYGQNLIRVMAQNYRLALLPQVLTLFNQYRTEHDSVSDVEVISATTLTAEQLEKITAAVSKRLSNRVKINPKVDSSLIAGFIVRVGDMVIDNSIKGRLQRLTDSLQS